MITIDAPLYPLLLVEKSSENAESPKEGNENGKPEKTEKADGASNSDEVVDPKKPNGETKNEEVYSWSNYVRNNFVAPNKKNKKKGDLWTKLEQYKKVIAKTKVYFAFFKNKLNIFLETQGPIAPLHRRTSCCRFRDIPQYLIVCFHLFYYYLLLFILFRKLNLKFVCLFDIPRNPRLY
jgi:hypothetical protein